MVTFGLDISHHQAASLDLAQCRREGVEFVFLKSSESSNFVDPAFAANLNEARAAGMLVAAYHYVHSNATAAAQVANVARVVPKDVPVIPDVEANSGGVELIRQFVAELRKAGYRVPLLYLPRWYWQQIGSPSLAGLPPLWSSRYPDNVVGSLTDEYNRAPVSYWQGYGGLGVAVLQFTSSARVAGHQPLDANAYQGTRAQLAAVLGGGQSQEDDMPWNDTWTFKRADTGENVTVRFDDMIGNIYQMLFFGSGSEPWKGSSMVGMLKDLASRQLADVDEAALAAELAKQGATGATPAQVKAAIQEVFALAAKNDGTTTP